MATEAFCVRCRKKVEMEEEQTVQYKNKRWAKKGICPQRQGLQDHIEQEEFSREADSPA